MTQASTARRARLDALLDQGGLEQASAADRAWLTAERARDAGFDREVEALLRAEAHLREWGGRHTGAGQGPDEALAGIFAGLDAGLFDDDLALDEAPQFADGEGDVVGLAPRALASPVTVAEALPAAVASAAAAPIQASPRPTLLRDGRFMQLLAAAAAVVLVVTAGLSAVSMSSPESSEGAVAFQPSAPAPTSAPSAAPAPTPAPMLVMPSEPAAEQASPAAEADGQFFRDSPAEERATLAAAPAAQRPIVGGIGGAAVVDDLLRAPAPASASTGASAGASMSFGRGAATESADLAPQDAPPPAQARPGYAAEAVAPATEPTGTAATRAARQPDGAVSAGEVARYTTQAAMQQAMARCVSAARVVTYEVARDTGTVRVLTATGASATERRCINLAAQQTRVTPAPGVARQQQVTLRPVSDNSAQ